MNDVELNEHDILERKQKMTGAEANRYLALNRRKCLEMSMEEQKAIAEEFYGEDAE